jgi:hypothetical protein
MMSRYLADLVFIVMAAIAAFLLAGTPRDMKAPVPHTALVSAEIKTTPEAKAMETEPKSGGKDIAKRNIFASSGSYKDAVKTAAIPDNNPYILLGIVQEGPVMKAIFREYTDTVIKAAEGQRMIDGFQVAAVQNREVMIKKGKEKKVFSVYGTALAYASGQRDMKKNSDRMPLLIGILEGADKKAVFKDQSGNLTILETGRSLPDGSVVTHIDSRSVRLTNGKNKKDLTLYVQAFPKEPVGAFQSLPNNTSPSSDHKRKRHKTPNNYEEDQDQGGGQ